MIKHRIRVFFSATALMAGFAAPSAVVSQEGASFFEPFDQLNQGRWYVSSGWTNGSHQNCLWHKNRVKVENGKLLLSLTGNAKQGLDFSCGEVQTNDHLGYGTFEARMKVPYAQGMNANMFTFVGSPQDRPHNEIDFEFIAPKTPTLQTNFHFKGDSDNTGMKKMPDDDAFHDYAFIWEPGRIRWFIDGKLIRDQSGDDLPNEPQKMYLSLWSTDTLVSWMGAFQAKSAPQVLKVEWAAYTKLGSACAFEQSVLCKDGIDSP
ncbi:family 16 glycosylhydrolase [Rhodobacteraceae bacterium B1Z28]|uniref:Beta-glucanase n=1 Tax=Ruegeria haliotis TaxID=2747601 RepID=A0ABX2PT33_9RHOB|nr:family 16 glycosylhydrolase [Ruegeria haliotis]NVO57327.1 family 16 glycosylhydrolase [Ruegeria haliotis]